MSTITKEEAYKLKNQYLKPRSFNVNHSSYSIQENRSKYLISKCNQGKEFKLPLISNICKGQDVIMPKKCVTTYQTQKEIQELLNTDIHQYVNGLLKQLTRRSSNRQMKKIVRFA